MLLHSMLSLAGYMACPQNKSALVAVREVDEALLLSRSRVAITV